MSVYESVLAELAAAKYPSLDRELAVGKALGDPALRAAAAAVVKAVPNANPDFADEPDEAITPDECAAEHGKRLARLRAKYPDAKLEDLHRRALGGPYRGHATLLAAFDAAGQPFAKRHAATAGEAARILADAVQVAARGALARAELGKARNVDPIDEPVPGDSRSKFHGPAARALADVKARHAKEWADFSGGVRERHRMRDRHQRELDAARAKAELEAYQRSPTVAKAYIVYDRAVKHARGEE
ncbi:MAG TPA: hypothetical protein VLV45_12165 [Gemmatimonadales bacterium]|nr:hypothetical protein [Gemmatimonadales bacterium]